MRQVGNAILVVLLVPALLHLGCRRPTEASAEGPVPRVRLAPTWGPEVEGLQCRLRPVKRLWSIDANPVFKVDLRNEGRRLFAFDVSEPVHANRISLDGRWYRWPASQATEAKIRPLAPGTELADLNLTLPRTSWLDLTPGYHDMAVAFVFEGIEVISNRVSIEIVN